MRRIALVLVFLTGLTAPAFAQKAAIEAVNARWTELFNKGDFAGVASLYAEDATAFPPGSGMVKGRAAIGEMWKSVAEKVSDPKLNTLDVKLLGHLLLARSAHSVLRRRGQSLRKLLANMSWCGKRLGTVEYKYVGSFNA